MLLYAVLTLLLVHLGAPALTSGGAIATTHAAPAPPQVIPMAEARRLPLGTTVTVAGSVTVPAGAFQSGTFDAGFALQDPTGGIYVSLERNLGLQLRQQVRVTGRLAESFGLLILKPADLRDVKVDRCGPKVAPERVATGEVNEATEGRLVQIVGTITQPVGDDLPYGYRVFVDDGSGAVQVFVYASTGIDVSDLQPGQQVRVTGFSGQFADHYELNPRQPADIHPT
jgi:uncharacterized protein YdeI (BOF family)